MTNKPATPLPWRVSPAHAAQVQQESGVCRVADCFHADTAYIVHAANAYPELVAALRESIQAYRLQAIRDSADIEVRDGWAKLEENARALLAKLGEG